MQLLVSKRARVPLGDGFLARRIAGPGLAGAYFYQIRTEQALFALETKMELDQLRAYKVCDLQFIRVFKETSKKNYKDT